MQIKNRQQMLMILAATALVLLVGDHLVFSPLVAAWKSRSAEIADLRKQVAKGTDLIKRETTYRSRWENMSTNTLPLNTSLAEQQVLKAFDSWSQESRVGVNSISPQWRRDKDGYMTLECRVDAVGTISTLSRFLYALEKDAMALRVESLELTSKDKDGAQLALGLQVSGLVLLPKEETR
ncbi:MAG: hypothetical protein HOP33_03940 [Verrucomicrobia bacterium]|nr:hypothetical protein [Verrucomicrobiota bacterium]